MTQPSAPGSLPGETARAETCSLLPSLFSARLDRELPAADQEVFEDHLASCPECRRQWQLFQAATRRLQRLEPLPAPPELLPGILAAVAEQSRAASEVSEAYGASGLAGWLARGRAWWRRFDFSVSVPTAVATVAVAMVLAVLVKSSLLPVPGLIGAGAPEANPSVAATATSEERVARSVPGATLATTSPRRYSSPEVLRGSIFDTVPTRQVGLPPAVPPGMAGVRPDVLVVFQVAGGDELDRFVRECRNYPAWKVEQPHRGVMLLELPPGELPQLRELLAERTAAFAPVAAFSPDFARDREAVRVAIRLRQ